jgi:hypothetical protein
VTNPKNSLPVPSLTLELWQPGLRRGFSGADQRSVIHLDGQPIRQSDHGAAKPRSICGTDATHQAHAVAALTADGLDDLANGLGATIQPVSLLSFVRCPCVSHRLPCESPAGHSGDVCNGRGQSLMAISTVLTVISGPLVVCTWTTGQDTIDIADSASTVAIEDVSASFAYRLCVRTARCGSTF